MTFAAAPSQNEFLVALAAESDLPWSRVSVFQLEEYVGLPEDAHQFFGTFLRLRLVDTPELRLHRHHHTPRAVPTESTSPPRFTRRQRLQPLNVFAPSSPRPLLRWCESTDCPPYRPLVLRIVPRGAVDRGAHELAVSMFR